MPQSFSPFIYRTGNGLDLTRFDGTNDFLGRSSDLTGNADGKLGTISVWLRILSSGATKEIFANSSDRFSFYVSVNDRFVVLGKNSADNGILSLVSNTVLAVGNLYHLMASWDLLNTVGHLYLNGLDNLELGSTRTNETIDYTHTNFGIGAASTSGNLKFYGDMGQLYINLAEYIDLSNASNRAKFYNNGPVNLGADGSTPTGTAPIIFLNGSFDTFETNLGSGGAFIENGSLGDGGSY